MSVGVKHTIFYKSVHLTGYADDINIIGINKRAVSELYEQMKEIA